MTLKSEYHLEYWNGNENDTCILSLLERRFRACVVPEQLVFISTFHLVLYDFAPSFCLIVLLAQAIGRAQGLPTF